jgi:hypothetical protein
MMAIATCAGVVGDVVGAVVRGEELPFDFVFFIGLNIPLSCSNGYFPHHALKSFTGKSREKPYDIRT